MEELGTVGIGDPLVCGELVTVGIDDPLVWEVNMDCQMLLMWKPTSWGMVSCLWISLASLKRLGYHLLTGTMSLASCQLMTWSLLCECLTIADLS